MVWGSFLITAAALKTPTRNGYDAQGVHLTFLLVVERGDSRENLALQQLQRGAATSRDEVNLTNSVQEKQVTHTSTRPEQHRKRPPVETK